ncbi:hypothetical protein I5M32_14325 [Pedobacter sp. SD-b]|uniref:DUF3108 domain-containing protein n=1 Tax=Pedobacter segetis TaxID=2793069 RepID=A0ABS1BML9_9SPHI|nr:hypothetical protein [Pedobacter segetis]MBK0384142.1 hypothetical protein [Pedobacter segetis]
MKKLAFILSISVITIFQISNVKAQTTQLEMTAPSKVVKHLGYNKTIVISEPGQFTIEGLKIGIRCYDTKWGMNDQNGLTVTFAKDYPQSNKNEFTTKGEFKLLRYNNNAVFNLDESIKKIDENSFIYEASLSNTTGVEINTLALSFNLTDALKGTKILFDDKEITMPNDRSIVVDKFASKVKKVVIPLENGKLMIEALQQPTSFLLHDSRKFDAYYDLRFYFSPLNGLITKSDLKLKISYIPY